MSRDASTCQDPTHCVNAIDPSTLTPIVQKALDNIETHVLSWTAQPLSASSAVGHLFRISGTARGRSETFNWSMILKIVPAPNSEHMKFSFLSDEPSHFGYWRRELLFYQSDLHDKLPADLATPRCYHVMENTDSYWLWMEELAESVPWTFARYALAARKFGQFNGLYALERPLPAWDWLATKGNAVRWATGIGMLSDDTWQSIEDDAGQDPQVKRAWPDDVRAAMWRLWQEREEFLSLATRLPKTLVHGDISRTDLFVRNGPDAREEIVAIDWGLVGIAPLGHDISGLTILAVVGKPPTAGPSPHELDALDQHLFEAYLDGLHDGGWHGDPRLVRLGYTSRTAIHFSLIGGVSRIERMAIEHPDPDQYLADCGLSLEAYLDGLATTRRYLVGLAQETRLLRDELNL